MEKPACYHRPMVRPRRAGARAGVWVAAALGLGAVLALASCGSPQDAFMVGSRGDRAEFVELFGLLQAAGDAPVERFAALRQISAKLLTLREYGRLTALLTSVAAERPGDRGETAGSSDAGDPYAAWYLFTAAYAYEMQGSAPIAALYYDRIVKNWPDLVVDGRSIHFDCLSRLIETVASPERRIEYYKDLIARFPDRVDMGRILFLLGKEYENVGEWNLAVKTYSKFLPYFGSSIPGYPDALQYARSIVEFYNSPKDWAYQSLPALVANVKSALASGDSGRLKRYRAKVNFFAMSWHQDEGDVNSQGLFDFAEFMSGGHISAAEELDPASSPTEAYLKTWGWSERIAVWYLYFRKISFAADPEIRGQWEWAGIYFGEMMQ
jgi:hypothetical protein